MNFPMNTAASVSQQLPRLDRKEVGNLLPPKVRSFLAGVSKTGLSGVFVEIFDRDPIWSQSIRACNSQVRFSFGVSGPLYPNKRKLVAFFSCSASDWSSAALANSRFAFESGPCQV